MSRAHEPIVAGRTTETRLALEDLAIYTGGLYVLEYDQRLIQGDLVWGQGQQWADLSRPQNRVDITAQRDFLEQLLERPQVWINFEFVPPAQPFATVVKANDRAVRLVVDGGGERAEMAWEMIKGGVPLAIAFPYEAVQYERKRPDSARPGLHLQRLRLLTPTLIPPIAYVDGQIQPAEEWEPARVEAFITRAKRLVDGEQP